METLKNFWLVGLSYRNAPLEVREQINLSREQVVKLIEAAKQQGITSILPISTCNRTEVYAMVENPQTLFNLFDSSAQLKKYAYTKNAREAVSHLFKVTAGLDSQILGDAQITGQVREFLQVALQHSAMGTMLTRLAEDAISAGKKIKNKTQLNNGASSIAHVAVKHVVMKRHSDKLNDTQALVIGAGKMSRLTIDSLLRFRSAKNITVINRTNGKAAQLAKEFGVSKADYNFLKEEIRKADLIFAATSSAQPIITSEFLREEKLMGKTFIDLALPRNVEAALPATIFTLDQLIDTDKRKKENYTKVAEMVILESIGNYYQWLHRYELAQTIKSEIHHTIFDNGLDEADETAKSKFVDGVTGKYLRHFQKEKQSHNLAA